MMRRFLRVSVGTAVRAACHLMVAAVFLLPGLLLPAWAVPAGAQADGPEEKVRVSVAASQAAARPGDQFAIAVVFDHDEGWHVQADADAIARRPVKGLAQDATTIGVKLPPALTAGPVQWPKAASASAAALGGDPRSTIAVFEGTATAYMPLIVSPTAAPGDATIEVAVHYQACDATTCLLAKDLTIPVTITIVPAGTVIDSPSSGGVRTFRDFDASIFEQMLAGTVTSAAKRVNLTLFDWNLGTLDASGTVGLGALLVIAAVGGALLNFTPCVLPVIPIKIMSLSQAAGNPARCFLLGLVMSLGVIAFWVAIGAAIAFIAGFTLTSQLFQLPGFGLGVGVFILVMALGMFGLFTARLPRFVYSIDPNHESLPGSFLFGVFTAILSTPCTAPFMAAASAWAATQPAAITLGTFASIGVGMALPYLVLSAFPSLLSRVPRTGPASELVKQVMGLLMIAVAVFFIGTGLDPLIRLPVDPPFRAHWWGVAFFVILAMGWLVHRTFKITPRQGPRAAWSAVGVLMSATSVYLAVLLTDRGPIDWVGYTPERFNERIARGEVVVMDFTAEWCLNCKALEAGVLHQPSIVALLHSPGVTPMKVDLSGRNRPGREKLNSLDRIGIPLLAVFGPGLAEPLKYDTYTPETVRRAIEQARGPGAIPTTTTP